MSGKLKRVVQDSRDPIRAEEVVPEQTPDVQAEPAAPPTKEEVIDAAAFEAWKELNLSEDEYDLESVFVGPTDKVDSYEIYDALRRQNPHLPENQYVMNPDLGLTIDSEGLAVIHLVVAIDLKLPLA